MPSNTSLLVKVGIFILAGLMLLVGFSLRVGDGALGRNRYEVVAYFEKAVGIETGSDVLLAGVRAGKVRTLAFDSQRRAVKVTLAMSGAYQLPDDSIARIQQSSLLGGSEIVVQYGAGSTMLKPGAELKSEETASIAEMMASVADVGEEAKAALKGFNENQGELFGKLEAVVEENREDFRKTSEAFAKTGPKLEELADRLNTITADVVAGKGTMGKMFQDDALFNDLKLVSQDLKNFTAEVRDGNGTLHKLVYSEDLALKAEESFEKVGKAGDEIQSLLAEKRPEIEDAIRNLQDLGPKLEQAVADFREIGEKINSGEGTLGKLVNDPSLYNDARKTMNQVGESFQSSEEQGVVRSFFGVLFGAII